MQSWATQRNPEPPVHLPFTLVGKSGTGEYDVSGTFQSTIPIEEMMAIIRSPDQGCQEAQGNSQSWS